MDKLPKVAIYLGIGIGVTMFVLFLFSILPHIIENAERDWNRAMGSNHTEEELKAMFYAHPSYSAFKEKYPDASESFETWNRGEGRLNLAMYNYENLNEIRLDLSYDEYRQNVEARVICQVHIPGTDRDMHREMEGDGIADFIQKVNCLEIKLESEMKQTGYSDYTTHPQIVPIDR